MIDRMDMYSCGEYYYSFFNRGRWEVHRETNYGDDYEVVFRGSYEGCVRFFNRLREADVEYSLGV